MRIYLIRHGQTDWNNKFLIQGRIDNPLNEAGIKQAKEVAKTFKGIKPDKLISSSLTRARTTLSIISKANDWEEDHIQEDLFIERDFGELEGSCALKYKEIKNFLKYENYETNEALERRVMKGINKIISENKDNDIVVVVCHSHVMKAFLSLNHKEYDYTCRLGNCTKVKVDTNEGVIKSIKIE